PPKADIDNENNNIHAILNGNLHEKVAKLYPVSSDQLFLVWVGVGLRLAYLRDYGQSALGFTLLMGALAMQWAVLCRGVFQTDMGQIFIGMESILGAERSALSAVISYGAFMGLASPLQALVLTFLHVPLQAALQHHTDNILQTVDRGGSISIHLFAAVFGVTASWGIMGDKNYSSKRLHTSKHSQILSMVGMVVMVIYMNSSSVTHEGSKVTLDGRPCPCDDRYRLAINTFLAVTTAVTVAFPVSSIVNTRRKFNFMDIQTGVLGGSVAVAAVAELSIQPIGAMVIGAATSIICILSKRILRPRIRQYVGVHDTACIGVSHGLGGLLGALVGVIMAATAPTPGTKESDYNMSYSYFKLYPARSPTTTSYAYQELVKDLAIEPGLGRSALTQAQVQLLAIAVTVVTAAVAGAFIGKMLSYIQQCKPFLYDC
ncbi:unnamed protein product, partial [Meganyctiphanes norvegica]